jgi:hypothetical protein
MANPYAIRNRLRGKKTGKTGTKAETETSNPFCFLISENKCLVFCGLRRFQRRILLKTSRLPPDRRGGVGVPNVTGMSPHRNRRAALGWRGNLPGALHGKAIAKAEKARLGAMRSGPGDRSCSLGWNHRRQVEK